MKKNKGYKKLREKLPHRYTELIAGRLENISASQVKYVMRGEIKDISIVRPVLEEANKIVLEQQEIRELAKV